MPFLPLTVEEMHQYGWERPDFVYVIGDAYIDHPSFGPAIISRVLENFGYKVCIISQPDIQKMPISNGSAYRVWLFWFHPGILIRWSIIIRFPNEDGKKIIIRRVPSWENDRIGP